MALTLLNRIGLQRPFNGTEPFQLAYYELNTNSNIAYANLNTITDLHMRGDIIITRASLYYTSTSSGAGRVFALAIRNTQPSATESWYYLGTLTTTATTNDLLTIECAAIIPAGMSSSYDYLMVKDILAPAAASYAQDDVRLTLSGFVIPTNAENPTETPPAPVSVEKIRVWPWER